MRLRAPKLRTLTLFKDDEIYNTPVESMTAALRDHGPIVAIRRNGKVVGPYLERLAS